MNFQILRNWLVIIDFLDLAADPRYCHLFVWSVSIHIALMAVVQFG